MHVSQIAASLCAALFCVLASVCRAESAGGAEPAGKGLPDTGLVWANHAVDSHKAAVYVLHCDRRGLMWVGTNMGLYFYDGVNTHQVGRDDFGGIQIYAIAETDDCLYLGASTGLWRYDFSTGRARRLSEGLPREVRSLLLEGDRLLLGSLHGLFALDLAGGGVTDLSAGLPHPSVYSLLRDSRGVLYVGTYHGLARCDSGGRLTLTDPRLFVNCMAESADRRSILIGSEGGLYRYTPAADRLEEVASMHGNNIKSLAVTPDLTIVGTDNGVYTWSGADTRLSRHDSGRSWTLGDNEVWCVFGQPDGNVWAGHERGFSIASDSRSLRVVKLNSLVSSSEGNDIYAIRRDSRGRLWLGGTNGVVLLHRDGTSQWLRHDGTPRSLSHNRIRAITETPDQDIWLSTDGGINRYDGGAGFDLFHISDSAGGHVTNWVYNIVAEGDDLWAASYLGGLHRLPRARLRQPGDTVVSELSVNSATDSAIASDFVSDIVMDRDSNLWFLLFGDNNLYRRSPSGAVSRYDVKGRTGLVPSKILTGHDGRLWCVCIGGALAFDGSASPVVIRFGRTGSDESVLAAGAVGSEIWVSTMSNVWRVDASGAGASILPLPQRWYSSVYQDPVSGMALLGGTDEIIEVSPLHIDSGHGRGAIKMAVRDQGNGTFDLSDLTPPAEGYTLPYGGTLRLVVSALEYSPGNVQRLMYRLSADNYSEDSGEGWTLMPEGSNTITLSDLTMGRYMLQIKALGTDAPALSIPLHVRRPWPLSWWALSLYVLLAAGCAAAAYCHMRSRHRRQLRDEERRNTLRAVEDKLTFLSGMSHDLKTPLSMIIGPVSLLKARAADPETRRQLDTVYDNAVQLNNMIHRTLELNQLDTQAETLLMLSRFDAVEFCRSVFNAFDKGHPDKRFIFHSDSQQIDVEADAVKLESVMTNLLSNACKYSQPGATISCGLGVEGETVRIVVSDDGMGISETDQPLVFQRMFRAPGAAALREGTGLGLYLIKKYLELMHGNVTMYSREGQGTSFVVTLPAAPAESPAEPVADAAADGRPKVLVVEDNRQIRSFLAGLLGDRYQVLSADNGRSGLAIASSFMPDVIIADHMMPVMTGLEMCAQLKQNPRLASVPVIMLTAQSDHATEHESIRLGVDIFMSKPFEPEALLGRIARIIEVRRRLRDSVRIESMTQAAPIEAESAAEKQLAAVAQAIEDNIADPDLNVTMLCDKTGIANKQLYRLIKKYVGVSPLDYIRRVRLQKAAMLLGQGRFTVSEVCYMVGFKTPSYFAKCFQAQYGVAPSQYRPEA